MLRLDDVSVRYGSTQAMRGVSMEVRRGEIVALLGANGAGKSTTLKSIVGLVPRTGGDVFLDDRSTRKMSPEALLQLGVALVPEGRQVLQTLTVAENLRLGVIGKRRRGEEARWTVDRVIERFPALDRRLKTSAGALSGGEQQQLAIGCALLSDPRVLLLDEPSFGLAPLVVEDVFASLVSMRDDGVTILLVEQNAARAVEIADRVYVINQGVVAEREAGSDGLLEAELIDAYLGKASPEVGP